MSHSTKLIQNMNELALCVITIPNREVKYFTAAKEFKDLKIS